MDIAAAGENKYNIWSRGFIGPRRMQKQIWTDPRGYWVLNTLGTHPDSQHKGLSRALIEQILQKVLSFLLTNIRPMLVDIGVTRRAINKSLISKFIQDLGSSWWISF